MVMVLDDRLCFLPVLFPPTLWLCAVAPGAVQGGKGAPSERGLDFCSYSLLNKNQQGYFIKALKSLG